MKTWMLLGVSTVAVMNLKRSSMTREEELHEIIISLKDNGSICDLSKKELIDALVYMVICNDVYLWMDISFDCDKEESIIIIIANQIYDILYSYEVSYHVLGYSDESDIDTEYLKSTNKDVNDICYHAVQSGDIDTLTTQLLIRNRISQDIRGYSIIFFKAVDVLGDNMFKGLTVIIGDDYIRFETTYNSLRHG